MAAEPTTNGHKPDPVTVLVKALDELTVEKYSERFQVLQASYRFSGDDALRVDVLVPHEIKSRQFSAPVLVRIHGGFLITGSSLYPPWFNTWILDYAVASEAIIISPDYRLLPEVSGHDIMDDVLTFWSWLQSGNVDRLLQENDCPQLKLDLHRTLLVGESAGGYVATQLALTHYKDARGLIALYPMIDLKAPFWCTEYSKPITGVPNRSRDIIESHLKSQRLHESRCESIDRLMLAFSIVQNGRFLEFFDRGSGKKNLPSLFPLERLEDAQDADGEGAGSNLPEIFIFHGDQDSAVPAESSYAFVKKMREHRPKASLNFYTQDGDHGFDTFATLDTPWLKRGLKSISATWLGNTASHDS